MILDHKHYIEKERGNWEALACYCGRIEEDAFIHLYVNELQEFYTLFRRAASSLTLLKESYGEASAVEYLENLVGRAYGIIYGRTAAAGKKIRWTSWFLVDFPRVFRRHTLAFGLSLLAMLLGSAFGSFLLHKEPQLKTVVLPFGHGDMDPSKRVEDEESGKHNPAGGRKGTFSAFLIRNNISVSLRAIAFGLTFGIGTLLLLFYNGVMLGAVCVDYLAAGKGAFLCGWLLPHGSVEIPAILIAGQTGFLIAGALVGLGRGSVRMRFMAIGPDIAVLAGGSPCSSYGRASSKVFFPSTMRRCFPMRSKWHSVRASSWRSLCFCFSAEGAGGGMQHNTIEIKTPEGVAFSLPLAGAAVRCFAVIIDFLIVSVGTSTIIGSLGVLAAVSPDLLGFLAILSQFILSTGYAIATEGFLSGQTFGKKVFGIRVMDGRGLPLRFFQVFVRNIVRPIDQFPCFYLVGAISCLFSRSFQRLGDHAAGTIVVLSQRIKSGGLTAASTTKYNSLITVPHIASRIRQTVPPEQAALALEALSRARELDPQARIALFGALTDAFKKRIQIPLEYVDGIPDETFVGNVVQVLYAEHGRNAMRDCGDKTDPVRNNSIKNDRSH